MIFFWLSAFSVALLSIIMYTIPPFTTTIAISSQKSFSLTIFKKAVQQSGVEDFLSSLTLGTFRVSRHHHQRKPKRKCDKRKWKSRLVSIYKVALVLTVDLKGCANFSSVQEAINAVPEYSSSRTLIIVDSGTYRSLSHTKFSCLNFIYFS